MPKADIKRDDTLYNILEVNKEPSLKLGQIAEKSSSQNSSNNNLNLQV